MHRLKRRSAVAVVLLVACAQMGLPPGGPPRSTPPVLLHTSPDSIEVPADFKGAAEFQFDEVVSEGSTPNFGLGTGDLEKLVLLSPDTTVPQVEWHRSRLTVRPRGGWKPNTVYRIELLPGIRDLQPKTNETKTGAVITIATGAPRPTRYLTGRAIDWLGRRAIPSALIQALHLPDSMRYITQSDSTGRFRFGPLPSGEYLVAAVADQDRNHRRGVREAWDTVRVGAARDSVGEIWAFARDSLPPRAQSATRVDSSSINVTFAGAIDPYHAIPADSIVVKVVAGKDTVPLTPLGAWPKAKYDTLYPAASKVAARLDSSVVRDSAGRDSLHRDSLRADSLHRDSLAKTQEARRVTRNGKPAPKEDPPLEKRPALGSIIVIRMQRGQVQPGQHYLVEMKGVRTAAGVPGVVRQAFTTDKPKSDSLKQADSLKAASDSLKGRADSTKKTSGPPRRADSLHRDSLPARTHADSLKTDSLRADSLRRARGGRGGGGLR
jgi:hypothetical protein